MPSTPTTPSTARQLLIRGYRHHKRAVLLAATAEAGSTGASELETAALAATAGRTALIVAHRLTQAEAADRVIVLDDGRIIEHGTHDELVAGGGRYAQLWQAWSTN